MLITFSHLSVAVPCSDNLPAPTNGAITYAGGSTNNRPVGATATYSCLGDYTLVGVSVRTCGSDGEWSGFAPSCQSKWNWRILFVCECVRILLLFVASASESSLWSHGLSDYWPLPQIVLHSAKIISIVSHTGNCRDLPSLANGMITYSAGSTNSRPFISHAVHSCNTGYTLTGGIFGVGTNIRVCVSGGIWDGSAPTCQREFCNSCTVCVCEYTHVNQMNIVWIKCMFVK